MADNGDRVPKTSKRRIKSDDLPRPIPPTLDGSLRDREDWRSNERNRIKTKQKPEEEPTDGEA